MFIVSMPLYAVPHKLIDFSLARFLSSLSRPDDQILQSVLQSRKKIHHVWVYGDAVIYFQDGMLITFSIIPGNEIVCVELIS